MGAITPYVPPRPEAEMATPDQPVVMAHRHLSLHPSLTYRQWAELGKGLQFTEESIQWWVGDWMVYGEDRFPDHYEQAVWLRDVNVETLRAWTWVSRVFPPDQRLFNLTFSHYREVGAIATRNLPEALRLLERARDEGLAVHQLRRERQAWLKEHHPDYLPPQRGYAANVLDCLEEALGLSRGGAHDALERIRELGFDVVPKRKR